MEAIFIYPSSDSDIGNDKIFGISIIDNSKGSGRVTGGILDCA